MAKIGSGLELEPLGLTMTQIRSGYKQECKDVEIAAGVCGLEHCRRRIWIGQKTSRLNKK